MSVDFAYKAIENLYFLLPAAVLALNRFMHKDFFNQRIQQFGGQLRRVDILPHQPYPLFSVNGGLRSGFHRFVKLLDFLVQLLLFALILLGQHIEVVLCNASGSPVLVHLGKQPVNLCFSLLGFFQFGCLFLPRRAAFLIAGVEQPFQKFVLVLLGLL